MAISIWSKPAELTLPVIPFDTMMKGLEYNQQRLDKIDEAVGKTQGAFAALQAAPGHEDLAAAQENKYNTALKEYQEKFSSNPTSRDAVRELSALQSKFATDPINKTIANSYEFYTKYGPTMWEEKNKGAYVDAAGVLDEHGNFKQNNIEYNINTFKVTPYSAPIKPIQEQYSIQRANKKNTVTEDAPLVDEQGKPLPHMTKQEEREWRDKQTMKNVARSTFNMIWDNPNADPGFRYLKVQAEHLYPNDEEGQKDWIVTQIKNAGVPFEYDWRTEKTTWEGGSSKDSGDGDGTSKDKSPAIKGTRTTISLDHIMDMNDNVITSTEALGETVKQAGVAKTQVKGEILNQFPDLKDNPAGFVHTEAGEEINLDAIKDPQLKSQAAELNAKYISTQNRERAYKDVQSRFMIQNGLNPDLPLDKQVSPELSTQANNYASDVILSNTDEQFVGLWGVRSPFDSRYVANGVSTITGRPLNNLKDINDHIKKVYDIVKSSGTPEEQSALQKYESNGQLNAAIQQLNSTYNKAAEEVLKKDPRYAKYSNSLESYLNADIYTEAFNYTPLSEDDAELRSTVIQAKQSGRFDRAKYDRSKPALKESDKDTLMKNNEFWEKGNMTIRFDPSSNDYVVDVTKDGETIEVHGIDDLGRYVQKVDPTRSNDLLKKQQLFYQQLDDTNGRASTVQVYTPVQSADGTTQNITTNYPVKTAYESIPTLGINQGDFMFKLPGLNASNVIVAKSHYDIARLMDGYNALKSIPGLSDQEFSTKFNTLLSSVPNLKVIDGKIGKVNNDYFPMWNAKPLVTTDARSTESSSSKDLITPKTGKK